MTKARNSRRKLQQDKQAASGRSWLLPAAVALLAAVIVGAVVMAVSGDDGRQQADVAQRASNIALQAASGEQFELSAVLPAHDHTVFVFYRGFG